jgi:hypothetical protein
MVSCDAASHSAATVVSLNQMMVFNQVTDRKKTPIDATMSNWRGALAKKKHMRASRSARRS